MANTISLDEDPFKINVPYSVVMGIREPSFNSIKTSLYNEVIKNMHKDILSLKNAPSKSIYHKSLDSDALAIYKDILMIILQSISLPKMQLKLGPILFCDATYFSSYLFLSTFYNTLIFSGNKFILYTTPFFIMKGKKEKDYKKVF